MEREHERSRREVEREMEIREMDAERFKQWKEQVIRSTYVILLLSIYHSGKKFHLEQARLRSKIRIKDGRATAIDLLAKYIDIIMGKDQGDSELHEPYIYLNGLGQVIGFAIARNINI